MNYDYDLIPKSVNLRGKKPMPEKPIGEVIYEHVSDYISIVDGKRVMFDRLTNLEVNKWNWPRIEASRPFNK